MKKVVKKWFWAWNDDKEEDFLEAMAKEGYQLEKVQLGKYTFTKTEPSNVRYQLDFKGLSRMKEDEYLQIYEDSGWECIDTLGSWYYFRKKYTDEEPDVSIFNDNKSRLEKYRRIIVFLLITGFPLYYQITIIIPNMELTEFEFPKFYYFFRIIIIIFVVIHAMAMLRILYKIIKDRKDIRE